MTGWGVRYTVEDVARFSPDVLALNPGLADGIEPNEPEEQLEIPEWFLDMMVLEKHRFSILHLFVPIPLWRAHA